MTPDVAVYCRICKRALEVFRSAHDQTVTFLHIGKDDGHKPEPVPLDQLEGAVMSCDFCRADNPAFYYATARMVRTHKVGERETVRVGEYRDKHNAARVVARTGGQSFDSDAGTTWAACEECADLIDAGAYEALITRVVESFPAKMRRPNRVAGTRAYVRDLYATMLPNIHGGRQANPYHRSA